jgi:hypothetical protein
MSQHCRANPCCGDRPCSGIPLPQHASGLPAHNKSIPAALTTPPQPVEPVAWRYRYKGGKWVVQKNKPHWYKDGMTDVQIEPLFPALSGGEYGK